jgi:magnesium-transporting ATPase (P-type)
LITVLFPTGSTLHSQLVPTAASPLLHASDDDEGEELALLTRMQVMGSQSAELQGKIKKLEGENKQKDTSKAKLPSVTINGVFQADGVAFNQDDDGREAYGRIEGGGAFRRARLGAKGAVADRMDYFMQMDFAFFGRPTFTNLWVDFTLSETVDAKGRPSAAVLRFAYLNSHHQTGLSNPLDEAINAFGIRVGLDISSEYKVDEVPYDFIRKRLSVIVADQSGLRALIIKGALDNVLQACTTVQDGEAVYPLDKACQEDINDRFELWSGHALHRDRPAVHSDDPET